MKIKVNTVEQFKVLEYIKQNFNLAALDLKLEDNYSISIQDSTGEKAVFKYEDGKVNMHKK